MTLTRTLLRLRIESQEATMPIKKEYTNERVYKRNSAKIYILALLHPHDFFAVSSHNV